MTAGKSDTSTKGKQSLTGAGGRRDGARLGLSQLLLLLKCSFKQVVDANVN